MAQINLLKQKKAETDIWQLISSLSVKILAVGVLILVVYYGYLFIKTRSVASSTIELEQKMEQERQEIAKIPNRDELFVRQQQLKELKSLIGAHPYWSNLLPALAEATLKSSNFLTFRALADGTLSLSVTVPSIVDLDKFLQIFDIPKFNENFFDIKIGSIGRTQVGDTLQTTFDVRMRYNPVLLQYSDK